MRNFLLQTVLIAGLALGAPFFVLAAGNYGDCTYGEDAYSNSICASSGGSSHSNNNNSDNTTAIGSTTVADTPATDAGNGLTAMQKQSILGLIASFGADATTLANVTAALNGQASTGSGSGSSYAFTRDLEITMEGEDVKALQQYLNAHGYTVSVSGAGSAGLETSLFGPATKAALIKLQIAASIAPAIGYFGPITRAYVASH